MLYTLRTKEKWFIPTSGTYLVGVSAYTNMDLGLKGKPEGIMIPSMPVSMIRDSKGKNMRHDFDVFLHSLASYFYNRVYTNEKMSAQEVMDTAEEFVDKSEGLDKRDWISSTEKHFTK